MLPPRNLLIVSLAIFLATTVSLAPVEEKEREEAELEATEEVEGELSEEEEDDDDSQSQHKIKAGNLGTQQTITSVAAAGGSVSGGPSAGMGPNDGAAGSSAGLHGAAFSVNSAAAGGPSSSSGSASSAGSTGPVGSAGYPGSVESSGSVGSAGSAGSADHLGSAGSSGSVDPAGSAGSSGHLGSAGSADSAGSAGHPGFAGSPGSVDSVGSASYQGSAVSVDSAGSAGYPGFAGSPGSVGSAGSSASGAAAVHLSDVSAGQTHLGSDRVDSMFNGNGQKLLNGGGGGAGGGGDGVGAHSQTGALGTFGGGVSHLSHTGGSPAGEMNTGIIDPSSHDYLLGLMGGGLIHHFSSGAHDPGQKTPPTHLDSTGISSGVTEAPFGDKSILDPPADVAHHAAIGADPSGPGPASLSSGPGQTLPVDQPGPGGSSPGSGPDQTLSNDRLGPDGFSFVSGLDHSLLRPVSGSSLTAAGSSSSLDNGAFREQTEEAESADNNGNGRQTLLTDTNGAVTDRAASSSDLGSLRTDLTGGAAESVTRLHSPDPASTMEPTRDVTATESSLGGLHTESLVGVAHTLSGVSGIYSHTDFITVTADFIGRSTADPTGTPFDSSHPVVTDHTQMAGSVTEQYNPSGQGPEGAENVELEDTC